LLENIWLQILHRVDLWLVQLLLLLLLFLNRVTNSIAFWLSGSRQTSDLIILLFHKVLNTFNFLIDGVVIDWFFDLMLLTLVFNTVD
jgi:hypothetical protein